MTSCSEHPLRNYRDISSLLIACFAVVCGGAPALAQEPSEELTREEEDALFDDTRASSESSEGADDIDGPLVRRDQEELEKMKLPELEARGFVFGDGGAQQRAAALVWAILPGAVLHGAGHLYLGDDRIATTLALMEISGVALLGVGAAAPYVFHGQLAGSGAARPAFFTGLGLIISSYIIDIVGVSRGEIPVIYEPPLQRRGGWVDLSYRFMNTPRFDLRNVLEARLGGDLGGVYAHAGTLQDVSLEVSRYSGGIGARVFRGEGTEHQVFIEADGEYQRVRSRGRFDRWSFGAQAGGVFDMGEIAPALRRIYIGGRAGYLYQRYYSPRPRAPEVDAQFDEVTPVAFAFSSWTVPWETFGGMSFSERLNVELAYSRRDGEFLHDINRLIAVPSARITYRSADNLDLTFRAAYGSGVALWLGLKLWINPR